MAFKMNVANEAYEIQFCFSFLSFFPLLLPLSSASTYKYMSIIEKPAVYYTENRKQIKYLVFFGKDRQTDRQLVPLKKSNGRAILKYVSFDLHL